MKHIVKKDSPSDFEAWKIGNKLTPEKLITHRQIKKNKKLIWKKLDGEIKQIVKLSLLQEQGFICCYCQKRIELNENTGIEHFIERNEKPEKMFDYDNLFACCDGGDSERKSQNLQNDSSENEKTPRYCDRAKNYAYLKYNRFLSLNPLDINCETHFSYFLPENYNGKPEVEIKTNIIEEPPSQGEWAICILDLNNKALREMRGVWIANLIFDKNGDLFPNEDLEYLLSIVREKDEKGYFLPFCVALEQVLKNYVA